MMRRRATVAATLARCAVSAACRAILDIDDRPSLRDAFSLEFGRDVGRIWLLRTSKGMRLEVFDALKSVEEQELSTSFPAGRWKTITLLVSNYPVAGGVVP